MDPALHVVRNTDVAPSPWRNGHGVTRELLAWPPGEWIVRVSVAEIDADGPFSAFPGVERWFAVLDGEGVELAHDGGAPVRLGTLDPIHRFRGDEATHCRLAGGRTREFNLMVRRDAATATVTTLPAGHAATSDWAGCFAATPVRVRVAGEAAWQALPARALAWTTAPARLEIDAAPGRRGWRIDIVLGTAVRR
jgi:environmental stress-induced protein Ves